MLLFNQFSISSIIATVLVMLFSMSLHEFGHAAMATYWGDDTPRQQGRLTINPLVHINWIGFLMFVILGFGILGSVPVNPRNMRDPRWGSFWTSFAGPLMNLAIALGAALILRLAFPQPVMGLQFLFNGDQVPIGSYMGPTQDLILLLLTTTVFWNILLFIFNLLPFFPIDGWRMVLALLPGYFMARPQVPAFIRQNIPPLSAFLQQPAYKWEQWAQISQFVLLFLIMLGFAVPSFNILGRLIFQPSNALMFQLLGV